MPKNASLVALKALSDSVLTLAEEGWTLSELLCIVENEVKVYLAILQCRASNGS